jgi:hypothetical protein
MERKDREGEKGSKGRVRGSRVPTLKGSKKALRQRARRKNTECTSEKRENAAPSTAPLTGQTGQEGAAPEEHLMFWPELALRGS